MKLPAMFSSRGLLVSAVLAIVACMVGASPGIASPGPWGGAGTPVPGNVSVRTATPDTTVRRVGGLRAPSLGNGVLEPGTVLMPPSAEAAEDGAEEPTNMLLPIDVDGDGIDETLERTASPAGWTLAMTEPTGQRLWSFPLGIPLESYAEGVPSPTGPGQDVVYLHWARQAWRIRLIDGETGAIRWTAEGDPLLVTPLNYYGLSKSGTSFDLVTAYWGGVDAAAGGTWGAVSTGVRTITVQFRDLETGAITQELTLSGSPAQPSISLPGDIDGDGVGDLYTLEPISGGSTEGCPPDCAGVGVLRALTQRGETLAGHAVYTNYGSDGIYLWHRSWDLSGDGVPDPAVFMDYWGNNYDCEASSTQVHVLDGAGLDGLPEILFGRYLANQFLWEIVSPGDLDGNGTRDIVASGWQHECDMSRVSFEALGKDFVERWAIEFNRHNLEWSGEWAWWPNAGDLNGDGVHDAIVRVPYSERAGTYRSAAIDQRTGSLLWSVDDSSGWIAPMGDIDGDGKGDLLSSFGAIESQNETSVSFGLSHGDLEPMWSEPHVTTLPGGPYGVWIRTGRFVDGSVDVLLHYNTNDSKLRELVDGETGRRL